MCKWWKLAEASYTCMIVYHFLRSYLGKITLDIDTLVLFACFSISGTLIQQVIAQVMPVFALMYYFMKNESAGKQLLPWWSNFYVYGSHLIHAHCSLHQCKLLKVMNILVNIVTLMICLELNPRMFFDFFLLKVPKLKYSALFWMCTGCSDFFYFYL